MDTGEYPVEYVDFLLCRDVYHCTPSELAEQDADTILLHMEFMQAEAEVEAFRRQE